MPDAGSADFGGILKRGRILLKSPAGLGAQSGLARWSSPCGAGCRSAEWAVAAPNKSLDPRSTTIRASSREPA